MEQKDEDIIDHLEEEPPIEDFKTKIEDIYHNLPVSIQNEYKKRLRKKELENDFETEASYNVLTRLNDAYMRKRERSKITSQNKRDKIKSLKIFSNVETKKRGRPKNVTEPEPIKVETEPVIEPLQFELEDNNTTQEINDILQDLKIEESQPKKEVVIPPPPKLIRHSLSALFC